MKKLFFSCLLVILTLVGIAPCLAAQEESSPQYGVELLTNIPPAATTTNSWNTSSSSSSSVPKCSEGWFKTSYKEGTISQTIDLAAQGYTPIAEEHYHFVPWSDDATDATYTFTLTSDTTLIATFAIDRHKVTITAGENGTVNMKVNGEDTVETVFDYGTEITLVATPAEGYHFVQWSNGCWANPYVFTLTKDTAISAIFEAEPVYNAVNGIFSVAEGKHIKFSSGNLQYAQFAKVWSFAAEQYEVIGEANVVNDTLAGKIDIFGWSGNAGSAKWGVSTSENYNDYSGNFVDWGQNIGDGTTWRTLTKDEWNYLCKTRANAADLIGVARINLDETGTSYANGLILLPDTWTCPKGVTFKSGLASDFSTQAYANHQTFTLEQWEKLESAGAVFLPAAGYRIGKNIDDVQFLGVYWSATPGDLYGAYYLYFYSSEGYLSNYLGYYGKAVRLVQDCYTVATTCDETSGNIIGGGIYPKGTLVTLTAQANTGYSFEAWSDGNTDNPRIITVTKNVTLTATFKQDAPTQLDALNADTKVEKVLRNGQVLIIRNGNTYDLTGRKQKSGK